MIKSTGFDSIRIRIGFDSSLDKVARLLDICQEFGLGVLFGFATFYVNNDFFREFPDAKIVDRAGTSYPVHEHDYRWLRACIDHPGYRQRRDQLIADCARASAGTPRYLPGTCTTNPVWGRAITPATAPIL